jgi:hypothetical protein
MLYLIRRLVMKLNHPTALPVEAPVAVPGQGEPSARTRVTGLTRIRLDAQNRHFWRLTFMYVY